MAVIGAAALTGIAHSLIPDHWLPFVLIGRARGWPLRMVATISGLSGLVHAAISVLVGVIAVAAGSGAASALGENLEHVGALALIALGLGYSVWAWRKGGHFHPGGARFHPPDASRECEGAEGHSNPEHLHYHADDGLIRGPGRWGLFGLALLVGLNPCVLMAPILLAGATIDRMAAVLAALAYSVTAITMTVGLSVLGVGATRGMWVPAAARYMEAGSGLLIAGLGALFLIVGH